MLTIPEMTDARDKLRQADILIAAVRGIFISGGDVRGARLLQDAVNLVSDEVDALDRAIAATKP